MRHGTVSAYTQGCRCGLCTQARRNYQRRMRHAERVRQGKEPALRGPDLEALLESAKPRTCLVHIAGRGDVEVAI